MVAGFGVALMGLFDCDLDELEVDTGWVFCFSLLMTEWVLRFWIDF